MFHNTHLQKGSSGQYQLSLEIKAIYLKFSHHQIINHVLVSVAISLCSRERN